MSDTVARTLATALTGGPRSPSHYWVVEGTNSRGEQFTTAPRPGVPGGRTRSEHDARDFAAEVNANGGNATARRVRA